MSPLEARRAVGHPDIVEWLDDVALTSEDCGCAASRALNPAIAEIERLRTALRSVRASSDPKWQAQIISDALREAP